eukprot:TRINITY_DN9500_c0_g1_i1.p1 TRINITY_DN9500_c0_g1~~TRINITY_DN9500_c0_g1_i1.p1  ORF type:complete len:120 (-),score=48.35 TRINITY_DN9500_c0_g1_i1:109-468(-)
MSSAHERATMRVSGRRPLSVREELICGVQYVKDGDVIIFKDARLDPANADQFVDEVERSNGGTWRRGANAGLHSSSSSSSGGVIRLGYEPLSQHTPALSSEPQLRIHVDDFGGEDDASG